MAASLNVIGSFGDFDLVAITGDSSYPTGGYDVTAFLGPAKICIPLGENATHVGSFDASTGKFKFRLKATYVQETGAVDVSASALRFLTL